MLSQDFVASFFLKTNFVPKFLQFCSQVKHSLFLNLGLHILSTQLMVSSTSAENQVCSS